MKEIYKITGNIIQNQAVIGKIFRFNGFRKEDFLAYDSFLYKFVKEVPDGLGWNFFSIGKKNKWYELEIMFDNFYYKTRKWLKEKYSLTEEELKKFDIYYRKRKENIKGIVNNSLAEENYFASVLPTIIGFENNIRTAAKHQKNRTTYMKILNDFNYKYFFGENIEPVSNIPVFPRTIGSNEIFKEKDFDFDEQTNQIFQQFLKDIYVETVNVVIRDRAQKINKDTKQIEKEIYIFFKSLIPSIYQLGEEVFYDSSQLQYRAFADSYFYPSSGYYLKIFDVVFLTNFISNEIITKADTEILKKVLRDAVKNNIIDYFVVKTSIIKDKMKLSLEYDKTKGRYIYRGNSRQFIINPNSSEERKIIENIGEHFNTRWRYGLTVGIYTREKDNLFIVMGKLIQEYRKENIKIYLEGFEKENWFNYNNYLSVGLGENLQISNFNGLYAYLFNDRVLPIKPYMYWGTDVKTNTPIFLSPFKSFVRGNRHILLVGDSGVGKSILSQQMLTTILREKIIAIDPAGTFSTISNIGFPITKIDILKDMSNPIYIDTNTDLYKKMGSNLDYENFFKEKVEMILKILQIRFLETEYQLRKYVTNLLINIYKKYKGKITIGLLYKELEDIFDKVKNNKKQEINIWKKIFDTVEDKVWLNKLGEMLGAIDGLEGTYIYNILNKQEDFLDQVWSTPKMIFKVDGLNLSKLKAETQIAYQNKTSLQGDALIRVLHFELLLDAISQFFLINKDYMDNVLQLDYEDKIKSYLFIDEVHNLLDVPQFKPLLDNFIREIRNRYASAFLLTQNITDFPHSMLKNIQIKMFLTATDVNDYLTKVMGLKENNVKEQEEETKMVKILKLYFKEYEHLLDKHNGIESLGFYHYGKEVYLTKNILSDFLLKELKKIQT